MPGAGNFGYPRVFGKIIRRHLVIDVDAELLVAGTAEGTNDDPSPTRGLPAALWRVRDEIGISAIDVGILAPDFRIEPCRQSGFQLLVANTLPGSAAIGCV